MTDNDKNLFKLLFELKKDEKISFDEYFNLLECIIGNRRVEYVPITYPTYPDVTSPWVTPLYYTTTTTGGVADSNKSSNNYSYENRK